MRPPLSAVALTDMDNWAAFNTVYLKFLKPDHYPVRMSFGVTSLGGAGVEVQCEAHVGKRSYTLLRSIDPGGRRCDTVSHLSRAVL